MYKPELSYDEAYTALGGLRSRRPPGNPKIPGSMTQSEIDTRNNSVIAEQARLEQLGPVANQTQNVYTNVHTRPLGGGSKDLYRFQNTPWEDFQTQLGEYPRVSLYKLWNLGLDAANALGTSQREYHDAAWGIPRSAPLPSAIPQDSPIRNPTIGGVPILLEDYPNDSRTLAGTSRFLQKWQPNLFTDINGNPIPQLYENDPDAWMLNAAGTAQNQAALLAGSAAAALSAPFAGSAAAPLTGRLAPYTTRFAAAYPRLASYGTNIAKFWGDLAIPGYAAARAAPAARLGSNLMTAGMSAMAANAAQDSYRHGATEAALTGNNLHGLQSGLQMHAVNSPIGPMSILPALVGMGTQMAGEYALNANNRNLIEQNSRAAPTPIADGSLMVLNSGDINPNSPLYRSLSSSDPRRRAAAQEQLNQANYDAALAANIGSFLVDYKTPLGLSAGATQERDDALFSKNIQLVEDHAKNIDASDIDQKLIGMGDSIRENLIARGYSPEKITPDLIFNSFYSAADQYAQNTIDEFAKIAPGKVEDVAYAYDKFRQGVASSPDMATLHYYALLKDISNIRSTLTPPLPGE